RVDRRADHGDGCQHRPTLGAITSNSSFDNATPLTTPVTASATFTDPGTADTHTATWAWGDGSTSAGTVVEANHTIAGSHTYTTPGFYTVTLTFTDKDDAAAQPAIYKYAVVTNPVTTSYEYGAGSYASPARAYTANPSLTRTLNIPSLNAKYAADGPMNVGTTAFKLNHTGAHTTLTN